MPIIYYIWMYALVTGSSEGVEMNPESLTFVRVFQCAEAAFCRYSPKLTLVKNC